ncbi:hypothetical protein BH11ACT5_BH11ACT5_02600 [soil metagenome]
MTVGSDRMSHMIDWPNALVGFILGVACTVVVWVIDHGREKAQRRDDAMDEWKTAAKQIELLTYKRETTAGDLYLERVRYPVDRWRAILGPDAGFRLLDNLEGAYQNTEGTLKLYVENETEEAHLRFQAAAQERQQALVAFANFSRRLQSSGYHEVVTAEQRRQIRRDYLRHPIRTWKRQHPRRK